MLKFRALLLLILCLLAGESYSQTTAASYSFARTSGAFTTISGTGTAITTSGTGVLADDGNTTGIPIGFTFRFCGTNYTNCTANSNPVLSLRNTNTASFVVNATNILGGGWLMPMWTDGDGRTAGGGIPRVYYQTTGAVGSRVFTIEWSDFGVFNQVADHMNFQVKLYEGSNVVQFVYGTFAASPSGVIGIANSTNDFLTLTNSTATGATTAFNSGVTLPANGTVLTFTPPPPTVTTAGPVDVASTSATLGGNVTSDGGVAVTERGIVWSTNANPTTANNKVPNGNGTGAFSAAVGGLPAGTNIHVRAYAINSLGTSYGGDLNFTTALSAAAIWQVSNLSGTSVVGGIGVTVTSSGAVGNFSPCGASTGPYFLQGGAGSYTFNFSAPVGSVEVDAVFAAGGTPGQIHFVRNGVGYGIAEANLAGAAASACVSTLALAQNGDLVNEGNYSGNPNNRVIIPGPITSLTVSNVAANGAVFGLFLTPETYFQVANVAGTSTVNGVGVTVSSGGGAGSFSPCGAGTGPYFLAAATSVYTFNFGAGVDGVEVDAVFGAGGTPGQVHFLKNGASYPLAVANLAGLTASLCVGSTLAAVQGGDLVNTVGDYSTDPHNRVIVPGPASSLTVSNVGTDAVIFGFYLTKGSNAALAFTNTSNQNLLVAPNAPATPINALLAVTDQNAGLTLTWTIGVAPLHGTVVMGGTMSSTGGIVTPPGFTYQPTGGYSGLDGFTIYVSDGVNIVATTVIVNVVGFPPTVTTLPATLIGTTNATLHGSVNPNGLSTDAWFQYGTTTNYGGATSPTGVGHGVDPVQVSALVTTLSPGTLYHFRCVGTNSAGTSFGGDLTFTTIAIPPPLLNAVGVTNGQLKFAFTNVAGQTFTVLTATNVALPLSNWSVLGSPVEGPAGQYQFMDSQATNCGRRFYRVRWP